MTWAVWDALVGTRALRLRPGAWAGSSARCGGQATRGEAAGLSLEWVKRCPEPMPGEEAAIEIRPFYEPEDFGAEFTAELQARVGEMHRAVEPR